MNEIHNITKFTEWNPLYEFQIPNVKLDEFFYNIKTAGPKYTKTLVNYYKTYEQYIDLLDKKKHQYKINDLSGDILGTERVVFKSFIFDKEDIENIRENLVTYALSEFYQEIPDSLDIFGIKIKPLSFIDKEAIKYTLQQTITFDTTLNVISTLGGMTYENEFNGYYIWSDKKDKLTFMKVKTFENWVTDVTDKNVIVNYNNKKPKLSDIVIDTIKFIEDNFDKIDNDILNSTTKSGVGFQYNSDLKYNSIKIGIDKNYNIPYIHFSYYAINRNNKGYTVDITDDDYKYLSDYFLKIYKIFKNKDEEKNKIKHSEDLEEIENEKIRRETIKYNL